MKMLLKWVLGMVAALAALLLVLSIALPLLIDPNNYKDRISAAVKHDTGRDLLIAGEIQWKVLPSIGMKFKDLSLGNRAGFGERSMLDVEEATVSLALWPLLSRQVEIHRIKLAGVTAYLRSNADGLNNWQDLSKTYRAGGEVLTGVYDVPADFEIEVRGGAIEFLNAGREPQIEGFSDRTPEGPVQTFELQGELTLEIPQWGLAGTLGYQGLAQADVGAKLLGIDSLALSFTLPAGADQAGPGIVAQAVTDAIIDLPGNQVRFRDLHAQLQNMVIDGMLDVTSLTGEMAYSGELQVAEFNPKDLAASLGIEAPQTRNPGALTKLGARASFSGGAQGVVFPDLVATLDESTLSGEVSLRSFAPLQMTFKLGVNALNLDDYAILAGGAQAEDAVAAEGAGLLVGSMLFFTGEGQLSVARLTMFGLTAEDISMGLISQPDEIRLFPIISRFYGGQHQGDIRIDLSGPLPVLTANQMATGFDAAGLMRDLAGSERLRGTGDVYFQVRSELGSRETALRTLSGDAGFSLLDGAIEGVDLASAVEWAGALLGKPPQDEPGQAMETSLPFSEIIATGVITRGVLESEDLLLSSPYVEATGSGKVNLVDGTVNYLVEPVPVGDLALRLPEEYRGVAIPVRLGGKLSAPSVSLDVAGGIIAAQKLQLGDTAGELADQLLKGLLGGEKDKQDEKD